MIFHKSYEFVSVRSYEFVRISHLVKYVWIAVRSGWTFTKHELYVLKFFMNSTEKEVKFKCLCGLHGPFLLNELFKIYTTTFQSIKVSFGSRLIGLIEVFTLTFPVRLNDKSNYQKIAWLHLNLAKLTILYNVRL